MALSRTTVTVLNLKGRAWNIVYNIHLTRYKKISLYSLYFYFPLISTEKSVVQHFGLNFVSFYIVLRVFYSVKEHM